MNTATATESPTLVQTPTSAEKTVTFYTSYGYQAGDAWKIPFKLWVSERPDKLRNLTARGARNILQSEAALDTLTAEQKVIYEQRVHDLIADSESRETVVIQFAHDPAAETFVLSSNDGSTKTDRNGLLQGTLYLTQDRADEILTAQSSSNNWLEFHAISKKHMGSGRIKLIPPIGTSVISDIDDTIKDTGITLGHDVVLRNTFFLPFKQVPCMATLYSSFNEDNAFHYVSGAPWQLYTPLVSFLFQHSEGFPPGSLHMKNARTNLTEGSSYRDFWKLFRNGSKQTTYEQKITQISQIITDFPERKFLLIGDSGERDPEVFRDIQQRFPDNIVKIIIRDVQRQAGDDTKRLAGMSIIPADANQEAGCPSQDTLLR